MSRKAGATILLLAVLSVLGVFRLVSPPVDRSSARQGPEGGEEGLRATSQSDLQGSESSTGPNVRTSQRALIRRLLREGGAVAFASARDYVDHPNSVVWLYDVDKLPKSAVPTGIKAPRATGWPIALWLRELQTMDPIEAMDLSGTGVTDDDLRAVSRFRGLVFLDLAGTGIRGSGLAHLAALPGLRRLRLSGSHVEEAHFIHLAALPALTDVSLDHLNRDFGGIAHLANCNTLESLVIGSGIGGFRLSGEHMAQLEQMKGLRRLHIYSTLRVVTRHLAKMPRLEILILSGIAFDDDDLEVLGDHPALRTLRLLGTGVSGRGLRTFSTSQLEELHVRYGAIDNSALMYLSSIHGLKRLLIIEAGLDDRGIRRIAECVRLQEVVLIGGSWTRDSLATLQRLERLEKLRLRISWMTEDDIASLRRAMPHCGIEALPLEEFVSEGFYRR